MAQNIREGTLARLDSIALAMGLEPEDVLEQALDMLSAANDMGALAEADTFKDTSPEEKDIMRTAASKAFGGFDPDEAFAEMLAGGELVEHEDVVKRLSKYGR